MWAFDWMIADPICSIFIAILIAISVWGLIKESVQILMQRQPQGLDFQLPEACSKVNIFLGFFLQALSVSFMNLLLSR